MAIENAVSGKIIEEIENLFIKSNDNIIENVLDNIIGKDIDISLGIFLEQPPDTAPEGKIEARYLLGAYFPMQSPGKIVLYQNNLRTFFWGIVRHIVMQNPSIRISKNDLIYTSHMIVQKTYIHEQFHYCCNVFRELFGSQFNSETEEALAVAHSRQLIDHYRHDGRTCTSKIQNPFFELVINIAFAHTSRGYRDWHLYKGSRFKDGLKDYIWPYVTGLESKGIELSPLLTGMLPSLLNNKGKPDEEID